MTEQQLIIEDVEIKCPRCCRKATWSEPFTFSSRSKSGQKDGGPLLHVWGGWFVQEKFPSVIQWKTPNCGWRRNYLGVVRCGHCALFSPHKLSWPSDAYYFWSKGRVQFWAWSTEHALVFHAQLHDFGAPQTAVKL